MNEPIPIETNKPHIVQEVVCLWCRERWIDVRPEDVWLKDLFCPNCGNKGYTIATGQVLPEDDVEQ